MIATIDNPSDAYTIDATDHEAAALGILMLGSGRFGVTGPERENLLPLFLFGGGYNEWWRETFGRDTKEACESEGMPGRMAVALRSIVIGNRRERTLYLSTLERLPEAERESFAAEWHDSRRSSTSDIGGAARELAARLEARSSAVAKGGAS